jgi:ABC-type oligopeptide transport system substrate-binding subunit
VARGLRTCRTSGTARGGSSPKHFQVTLNGWGADYPTASTFIAGIASCNPRLTQFNAAALCDPGTGEAIAAAVQQQDFVSRRAGNVLVNPQIGPLVTQMWVL